MWWRNHDARQPSVASIRYLVLKYLKSLARVPIATLDTIADMSARKASFESGSSHGEASPTIWRTGSKSVSQRSSNCRRTYQTASAGHFCRVPDWIRASAGKERAIRIEVGLEKWTYKRNRSHAKARSPTGWEHRDCALPLQICVWECLRTPPSDSRDVVRAGRAEDPLLGRLPIDMGTGGGSNFEIPQCEQHHLLAYW